MLPTNQTLLINETLPKWGIFEYLLIFLATGILTWYLQYHWNRRHLYAKAAQVNGPFALPFIGSSYIFVGNTEDIFNYMTKMFESYPEGIFKLWHGSSLIYGVSNPTYLSTILNSPKALAKMSEKYKFTNASVGNGLLGAIVPVWKRHRKIINPAFNQKLIDSFVEVFVEHGKILNEKLEKQTEGQEFDFFKMLNQCSLDILCETAMGIKVDAQTTDSHVVTLVDHILETIFLRCFIAKYQFDFTYKMTSIYRREVKVLQEFHSFTGKVVKERQETYEKKMKALEENPEYQEDDTLLIKRKAFLDLLIETSIAENKLTSTELQDEVNTFMIAGTDTTATALSFVFLCLGIHPEIQQKVYEEIIEVIGPTKDVEPQDLPLLKYTEQVIKESLRLFPVGFFIARDIDEDLQLHDGIVLPKGSSVVVGLGDLHRNPKNWKDPLKFDPDRFLPEEILKRHPFVYLPFSGGPRNCIAIKYAMMTMKSLIAMSIRNFEFTSAYKCPADVKIKSNLILRCLDGLKLSVKLRNQKH